MSDSNPLVGVIALVVLAVAILIITPAGPGALVVPEHEDYDQMWQDYQVTDPTLDFSVGIVVLLLNLGIMLGLLSYSLLTYRGPDDKESWRDLSYFEDDE
ncbi:MAG: hypothetical protein V5A55_14605 [Halovenus sp.]